MGKVIRLTETQLKEVIGKIINEAGPGRPQPKLKPKWTVELSSVSQNKIKWSENMKHYIGQGPDGVYHFYSPNNITKKSEFRKVGNGGQNTIGEYIVDPKSTTPFIGIKLVSQRNVTTHHGQRFV